MEMTPHNFVDWHPWEYLQVIRAKDILSPCHGNSSVILDVRGPGVNFLLLLIPSPWPLISGSKLFHWRGWWCCPHRHRGWGGRETTRMGAPLSVIRMDLVLMADWGSSFVPLIQVYISLLNFIVISARREHLLIFIQVSTKMATLMNLTLTLFSFNLYDVQHVGRWVWT